MLLIKTDRDTLLKPLQEVTGVVERRHTLPILSNVLIERSGDKLSLIATDLEIQVTAITACTDQDKDFSITVSAKKLLDICRSLPEGTTVSLDGEDSRLQLKGGKSRFSLQTLPAVDFPRVAPSLDVKSVVRLSQKTLKRLLNLVQFSMAQQDIRYYLNGLLLIVDAGQLKVVATDGHRLSLASVPLEETIESQEVILPRKTVVELIKLLTDSEEETIIEIAQNQVKFTFGNIILVSKVIDGKFPDHNRVIPTNHDKNLLIARTFLLQALQRVSILSNEKFRGVRLVLTGNNLRIVCNNSEQEEAQEEMEIEYAGDALDIGFNVSYLLDVLNNLGCENVACSFGDANSSMLMTVPGEDSFKYVVMPMRI
jgi:DNA polymerase-3 subunit beta